MTCQPNLVMMDKEVGSILGGGGTTPQGHFFRKQKKAFSKIKRALLCLLQNLGGHVPPVPPVPTFMMMDRSIESKKIVKAD